MLLTRLGLQELARIRLREAEALFNTHLSDGAYYLAGYAVECALKACIARGTAEHDFPPDPKAIAAIYSHDLRGLMKAAGLSGQLADDAPRGSMLDAYWGVVFKWNERSRYRRVDAREARELLEAITEQHDGVFQWLQRYW